MWALLPSNDLSLVGVKAAAQNQRMPPLSPPSKAQPLLSPSKGREGSQSLLDTIDEDLPWSLIIALDKYPQRGFLQAQEMWTN